MKKTLALLAAMLLLVLAPTGAMAYHQNGHHSVSRGICTGLQTIHQGGAGHRYSHCADSSCADCRGSVFCGTCGLRHCEAHGNCQDGNYAYPDCPTCVGSAVCPTCGLQHCGSHGNCGNGNCVDGTCNGCLNSAVCPTCGLQHCGAHGSCGTWNGNGNGNGNGNWGGNGGHHGGGHHGGQHC